MSARQFASLACKLIALVMFAMSAQGVFATVGLVVIAIVNAVGRNGLSPYNVNAAMLDLVLVIVPIGVGLFLLWRADYLAAKLVPDEAAPGPAAPGPADVTLAQRFLPLGLTIAGAVLTVTIVRDLVTTLVITGRSHTGFDQWWHDVGFVRAFWSDVAGIALSAWLMFGSRGIARLVGWARTAGTPAGPAMDN